MANTTNKPIVMGREHFREQYIYKSWWLFRWYEKISSEHIANDIVIESKNPISQIILNGKVVWVSPT